MKIPAKSLGCYQMFISRQAIAILSLLVTSRASAGLTQVASFPAPGNAVQMVYAPASNTLFLRNSASAIRVVDTTTGQQTGLQLSTSMFTDMSLSPSGDYLYVADYGGTHIGYGTPSSPSYVDRYSTNSHTWSVDTAPAIAYKIQATDDSHVLLLGQDQWVDLSYNSFGPASMVQLSSVFQAQYEGGFAFDPTTGRAILGTSGISSDEIRGLHLIGNSFSAAERSGTYGSAQGHGGTYVLSTDHQRFYYGNLQVEALDVTHNLVVFPEVIYAATTKYAFGSDTYYDAATGAPLGHFGFTTNVYALSADGSQVWAFNPADAMLHLYSVPEPSTLALAAFGLVSIITGRLRKKYPLS